jgi:hypothetical protein
MKQMLTAMALMGGICAQAESCEGGLYLNPQVIRGEGTSQSFTALKDLIEFVRPTGLSVTPVVNIKETLDVLTAVKKPTPPCWIYANPTVGLASGYRPVAINTVPIQAAVLILTDAGAVKDGKPVELKDMSADRQAKVLARLKTSSCFGIKSGVTTSLVSSENLCGTVVEVLPQQGVGQGFLPTKAALHWQPDRWAGVITRLQTAQSTSLQAHFGSSEQVHLSQLVIVPTRNAGWGYGIYIHPDVPAEIVKRAANQFVSLKAADPSLLRSLDLAAKYEFATPADNLIAAMKKVLAIGP